MLFAYFWYIVYACRPVCRVLVRCISSQKEVPFDFSEKYATWTIFMTNRPRNPKIDLVRLENVLMTSKWRHYDVMFDKLCHYDVTTTFSSLTSSIFGFRGRFLIRNSRSRILFRKIERNYDWHRTIETCNNHPPTAPKAIVVYVKRLFGLLVV